MSWAGKLVVVHSQIGCDLVYNQSTVLLLILLYCLSITLVLSSRDNLGRPIIYIDFYRFKKEDPDYCLRYMVFTMERAAQVSK